MYKISNNQYVCQWGFSFNVVGFYYIDNSCFTDTFKQRLLNFAVRLFQLMHVIEAARPRHVIVFPQTSIIAFKKIVVLTTL